MLYCILDTETHELKLDASLGLLLEVQAGIIEMELMGCHAVA